MVELQKKELWDKRIPKMLQLYYNDMFQVLDESYKALGDGGFCCIVVGNSAYGGIVFPADLILAEYAEKIGFRIDKIEVDRYIITSSQQYEMTKENGKYLRGECRMLSKERIIEVESLPMDIQSGAAYSIKQANPNTYTHGMFKYPCKFIPEIPRWGIHTFLPEKEALYLTRLPAAEQHYWKQM